MKTKAAVLWELGKDWSVEEIDLDPPKRGEVLVRLVASGMCHSDEHHRTGELPFTVPAIGGHEGAGIVEAVGPDVDHLSPGDHVVFSFIPVCGRCPSCASGHENLCDLAMYFRESRQISDHTARHHKNGVDLGLTCLLGSFAEHTVVHEDSCVKVPSDIPLEVACLLGCGVVTGWGSAVYAADVRPGDDVVVVGIGGVGINAVQGAKLAGAHRVFAIDPVEFKREQAVAFGATFTAASIDDAFEQIQATTHGRMANKVIMTTALGHGRDIASALAITAKRGRMVITNMHSASETEVSMSAVNVALFEKQIVGSLFGSANPRVDIPRLVDLYGSGQLKLDELVTRTYGLEDVNKGFEDMLQGVNLRGVIRF